MVSSCQSDLSVTAITQFQTENVIEDNISQHDLSSTESSESCFEILKNIKLKYPLNLCTAHLNINSIANKIDNLKSMLEQNLDIFCIAETKIDQSYPESQFCIPGYRKPYRLDISDKSGGLLVYVKETLPSRLLTKFKIPPDLQIIPIEINLRKSKWLVVSIYRPPGTEISYFIENITKLLDIYNYDNIFIMGDFNLESNDTKLEPFIVTYGLYSMNKEATCFKSIKGTCIDLLLTNKKYSFFHTKTFETGMSDHHKMVYTIFKTKHIKLSPKYIKYRCYKNYSEESFKLDLACSIRDQTDFAKFEQIFEDTLNKYAPFKSKIVRANNTSHMNKTLKNAIAKRSRLRNKANKSGNPLDTLLYKKQRNFVVKLNKETKRDYYKNLDPKKLNMNKQFWKTFSPFFSSKLSLSEKMILIENDTIITDEKSQCEIMNNHFSNLAKSLDIINWPEPTTLTYKEDAVSRAIRKFSNHPSIIKTKSILDKGPKFVFDHILPKNVARQIKKLDTSKSTRGDIPIKFLKEFSDIYITPFTDIINNSINDGVFPSTMKLADVTPIFKKDDNTSKENYRPISILSALSKVFERLLSEQISNFMSGKFSPYLCGFRKGHSTQHALLRLLENWRNYLDNKELVGTILCDLSKAFDTLPHDLIIAKLDAYGFGQNSLKLIYDYLTDRKQRCKIGSSYSSWLDICIGVPQGSVLGPLLFNIFINDFLLFTIDSGVCNFADDNSIYAHGKNIDDVVLTLEHEIKKAINWFENNSLVVNPDKFQLMFLGTRTKSKLCLNINGKICRSTPEVKLLGITIDWKLTFNKHVKLFCKNASKKASALMRLRNDLSTSQKLLLYNSFLISNFGYCPLVWMFCGKTANNNIDRVQKRALQAVYNDFSSSQDTLRLKGNHLKIHIVNLKCLLVEVYKSLHDESPAILCNIFIRKPSNYNLRINNLLVLPKTSTLTYGLHSFTYRGSMTWNHLPDELKFFENSSTFKTNLKNFNNLVCTCKLGF